MSGGDSDLTSGGQITMEEQESWIVEQINENEVSTNHQYDDFPKNINEDKQGKHIPGNKNYIPGRSILSITTEEAENLIKEYSGHGTPVSEYKERVDFGRTIGIYVDLDGVGTSTTVGIIHYSKTGAHIVPANPKEK